jgi:phosphoglycolate phosphatase
MVMIGNHLKKLMSAQIDRISLVEGMQQVITGLREQGVRLAIVTSNAERNVRQVIGERNIACFDFIETGVSMFGKTGKFQKVLKKAGISAGEAFSIGDEVRDLKSSRALQMPFGAVTWGYTARAMLEQHAPEALFVRPEQILETVLPGEPQ